MVIYHIIFIILLASVKAGIHDRLVAHLVGRPCHVISHGARISHLVGRPCHGISHGARISHLVGRPCHVISHGARISHVIPCVFAALSYTPTCSLWNLLNLLY